MISSFYSIKFEKETTENAAREIKRLKAERDILLTHVYTKEEYPNIEFKFLPVFSMIDGKMKNNMADNSSAQKCPDCGATPTEIMNDDVSKFVVKDPDLLNCGAISLHFGPRSVECLINTGSHASFKKYYCPKDKKSRER